MPADFNSIKELAAVLPELVAANDAEGLRETEERIAPLISNRIAKASYSTKRIVIHRSRDGKCELRLYGDLDCIEFTPLTTEEKSCHDQR